MGKTGFAGTTIGKNAVIKSGIIIYCHETIGHQFKNGHNVIIREKTKIGNRVVIGMSAVIENNTSIENEIILQRIVYIPTDTVIGNNVFITPNTVLTNDRNPPKRIGGVQGPKIRDGAAISANATLLPDISIGEGAPVAAGAIETRDVPAQLLAIGAPAKITDLHLKMIREMTRK